MLNLTLLLIIAIGVLVAMVLYYFVRTLLIMTRWHIGWGVAGFLLTPVMQLVFFVGKKSELSHRERRYFMIYFILTVLLCALAVLSEIMLEN